ncbi:phosphoribosylformylglycinamidine synthase subunit PurQ [Temperatibacter marinus]|uniref:Phosphoribosylformylglycinamidine synthase subunit PurQ n=1 Tax=Temperatibacter marinus TaxID=1456591 RepID=A0AA52H8V0_9PROT|nr:phosphoribosylformylglycinamidine synthase subunit PurQ [Temperatibacter marinus]WND02214.1 phosphoribosylformylglycinamidine synthase subunit PurQ [Temperatibacter marinus]
MKSAVIVFPGSNCDRDMAVALEKITGTKPAMVWHQETDFETVDFIALPGGFSYGDYLRCGAMSARSNIMKEVVKRAQAGVPTFGVCNGFQILTETGLLPGALMRNAGLDFVCKDVTLVVDNAETAFTSEYHAGQEITIPVAHHDGNYFADTETLDRVEGEGQVAFRYAEDINGSQRLIAGVLNDKKNVLGMMPHPERMIEPALGGTDGRIMFESVLNTIG